MFQAQESCYSPFGVLGVALIHLVFDHVAPAYGLYVAVNGPVTPQHPALTRDRHRQRPQADEEHSMYT